VIAARLEMTRIELLRDAALRFEAAGIEDGMRNAELLLGEVLGTSRAGIYAYSNEAVEAEKADVFSAFVDRRLAREPLQYITGHAAFHHIELAVSPGVLIPRPETEELVEAGLAFLTGLSRPWVLDVGTGSGAIALAIKAALPEAEVFGVDVSEEALTIAVKNAERLGLDVSFAAGDLLHPDFCETARGSFDLIVSNPPYVPASEADSLEPEVRDHEPGVALFVDDEDPLRFYRALAGHASRLLKPGGRLMTETHSEYGVGVPELFSDLGLVNARIDPDLSGRPRIASGSRPPNDRQAELRLE
jgi:release factor glutamine methyltransferase